MGKTVMGMREGLERKEENSEKREEGLLAGKVNLLKEWWSLVEVYVNEDLEEKLNYLREWMERRE